MVAAPQQGTGHSDFFFGVIHSRLALTGTRQDERQEGIHNRLGKMIPQISPSPCQPWALLWLGQSRWDTSWETGANRSQEPRGAEITEREGTSLHHA